VDADGETGIVDTHALIFEYLPRANPLFRASYSIFATPPRPQTVSDSIISSDDPDSPIPYTEIDGAKVLGSLDTHDLGPVPAVPLPPAAVPGLICLSGLALGLAKRRLSRKVADA
jgi:hypothetical protein